MKFCRSNLDLHSASSPSSVGKLRISSEMRSKLELVTANHSLRSTTKTEKPALSLLNNMQPNGQQRTVSKLEDNRKLLLEQQLGRSFIPLTTRNVFITVFKKLTISNLFSAGRWGSVDSVDAVARPNKDDRTEIQPTNLVRSQVSLIPHSQMHRLCYFIFCLSDCFLLFILRWNVWKSPITVPLTVPVPILVWRDGSLPRPHPPSLPITMLMPKITTILLPAERVASIPKGLYFSLSVI